MRPSSFVVALCLGLSVAACSSTDRRAADDVSGSPPEPAVPTVLPDGLASNTDVAPPQQTESELRERRAQEVVAARKSARAGAAAGATAPSPLMSAQSLGAVTGFAPPPAENRERYAHLDANPVRRAAEHPVSTFSVDVDTGSYSNLRRMLRNGQLPPADAVRIEELVNYFDYAYAAPRDASTPFSLSVEMAPTPWNGKTHLLHIGIQGWKPQVPVRGSNLVFLVDVSGSMNDPDKLPLVKTALKLLTQELTAADRVSLVVYAGASGVVLEPTPGDQKATILAALERLAAGGSTNGGAGIELAYAMARQGWIEGGVNRVLLSTDGDFNVGTTSFQTLIDLVETRRKSGVALTTLGFGSGNYNDHLMEQLADAGDGNHAYIDSAQEAYKVLVRQREATLQTIARDVKIQLEFNPAVVSEYRLLGYENRTLQREDFANDAVDAGDIGAGHTVTALYEVTLAGSGGERIQPLRYGQPTAVADGSAELAHLRLRYKQPQDGMTAASKLIERPLLRRDVRDDLAGASPQLRLSAAVAAFGQLLRGGVYTGGFDYTAVESLARSAGEDSFGERAEFRQLVRLAQGLSGSLGAAQNGHVEQLGDAGG